jgi:hypothetical protein
MQNLKELWKLANEEAKTNGSDAFEIYARLSGAKIISEYSDEMAEKLKATGYKFRLYSKFLYLASLDGKEKILPIFLSSHKHIFSEAGLIIDNKNGFWKDFICANFVDDEYLPEVKQEFDRVAKTGRFKQELKDYFGIIDEKSPKFGDFDEFVKSIPNLKANKDSVPYGGNYAIYTLDGGYEGAYENVYITKEPLTHAQIKIYEDLYLCVYGFAGLDEDKIKEEYGHCANIFEKLMKFRGVDLLFRKEYGEINRLSHLTIETGDENRTKLKDVKESVIETLLPLVKKGGGELDFIHSDFKGWSVDIRPLDKLLPFCWVFDILKDGEKKITCVLNGADYTRLMAMNFAIKDIFYDAWLKQTDVVEYEKLDSKICHGNMLFVSVRNLTRDCIGATVWIADFERCLAFAILAEKEQK